MKKELKHPMKPAILKQKTDREFHIPENCHIIEVSNDRDDPDLSIARARVSPGITTRWHRLKGTAERYYIISGTGQVEIGTLPPRRVHAGDVVRIPPMCPQRITNMGTIDLIFLAICTPRFSNEAYEDIEDQENISGRIS